MTGIRQYKRLQEGLVGPNWSVSTVAARVEEQTACSATEAQVVAHAAKNYSAEDAADSLNCDVETIESHADSALDQLDAIKESVLTPPYE